MATYSRPGVFVQEVALPQSVAIADNGTAVGAFVGALPKGPTTPTLVTSWSEFVKQYGSYSANYPTTFAVYTFFANGGRNAYIMRATASDAATASVTLTDRAQSPIATLLVKAKNKGAWGNDLHVEVKSGSNNRFSILVYGAPTTSVGAANSNILEQFNDLSIQNDDPRYVVSVINALSGFITVADEGSESTYPTNSPAAAGLKALSGGLDGSTPERANFATALTAFDTVTSPMVFNLPDVAYIYDRTAVNATALLAATNAIQSDLLAYVEARGDAFAVIDTPASLTGAEAVEYATGLGAAAAAGATGAAGAIYYPWLSIPDPIRSVSGATRLVPPGASIVGQYLATDASRGVFKAPAGLGNRVAVAVATERLLTNAELDALNSATVPVNAIRTVPGAGIVVMGARTMHNTPGDRYVNVRRSMIHVKKELNDRTAFAVFENNDSRLWNQIRSTVSTFLTSYWQQGGLRGTAPAEAFYVKCDSQNNTAADILNGRVNIEVGVAVEYPAEFVVITIGQITGSATVSN